MKWMNYKELCIFFIFCLFLPSITQIHNHLDETPEIEKITVFIMDKKPVNFLSEEDLLNLDLYYVINNTLLHQNKKMLNRILLTVLS